jgi:hypothetical protein
MIFKKIHVSMYSNIAFSSVVSKLKKKQMSAKALLFGRFPGVNRLSFW